MFPIALAVMTLPRGPVDTVDVWYAGSRSALCICGVFCWGAGCPPGGKMYHFVSRVKEKGSVDEEGKNI